MSFQPLRAYLTAALAAGLALFICFTPLAAEAVTVSPKLEEQVLQVLRQHPEAILESVQVYQQQQQQIVQQSRQQFLNQMQSDPATLIGQSPTSAAIPTADQNKILLVEFADFQCSFCAKAQPAVKQFINKHRDQVVLVYKNFPITAIHPEAMAAAKAAWAAHQQGKFLEYYDALYSQQNELSEALYISQAEALGLDMEQFERDRTSTAASQSIAADVQLAESLQIEGTPFFALKDRTFSGAVQLSELEQALALVQPS